MRTQQRNAKINNLVGEPDAYAGQNMDTQKRVSSQINQMGFTDEDGNQSGYNVVASPNKAAMGNAREDIKEIRDILCIKQPGQEGF